MASNASNSYYNRYKDFQQNGTYRFYPFIKIPSKSSDKQIAYKAGVTRFDKLSDEYYGNPWSGWMIMQANAEFGGMEFLIPNNTIITIPFPFLTSLQDYQNAVNEHILLYGV